MALVSKASLLGLCTILLATTGGLQPRLAAAERAAARAARPHSRLDVRAYLKKQGDAWAEVRREDQGLALAPSLGPSIETAALSQSWLFKPWVARTTSSWPEAVAVGDVNGDGRSDVVLTTSYYFDPANDHKLHVFLQDGGGNLLPAVKYPLGNSPDSVDIADLNGDGRNDVVVGNSSSSNIGVLTQNLSGALNAMVTYATTNSLRVRAGDFNQDGRMDVVSIGWGTDTASLFLQNAGGTLDPPVVHPVTHGGYDDLEVGDVNGDGRLDAVVMSGQSFADNLGVLLQAPAGGFEAAVYYDLGGNQLTSGVAVGDVTGDSREDVVVTYGGNSPSSFVAVFAQNAGGTLDPPVSLTSYDIPEPAALADVNEDGRKDVVVLHGGWTTMGTYLQGPTGTLAAEVRDSVPYASHYNPHGLALGDVDGDGLPDAVIADYNSGLVVLYHRPPYELGLTMTDSPDPAVVGSNVTYSIAVTNNGFHPMTGVTLTDTLPARMTFVSSVPDSRSCTAASGVVTCLLGTMAPGATVNVTIVGRIATQDRAERTYRNTAQVTANEAETDYTDNSALVTTRYIVPCTYPVLDGGFEAGTPSPYWSESSTNFGTPLCTLAGCGSGGDTAGPRSGTWWSWFGGVPGPETGALAQALVLPLGKARLTFFLWNGAASGNGTDVFRVLVDATPVFSAFEGAGAYTAGYTPVVLDLSRFADGASHVLRFEAQTSGPEVTTFSLDDVMIEAGPRARPRSSPLVCP